MKYICNGRIPGSTSGYPSDQDRAFKSDAVKGGYRAADTAVSLEHTASGGCCICPCIRTCIENTSTSHLHKFYQSFEEIKEQKFDGFIITGAPVEQIPFEDVDYWDELKEIMEWTKTHVTSTLHLCWGAQAGIYYHYGIDKTQLPEKMFGVFKHHVRNRRIPLVRGFDDAFYAPHSRHTEIPMEQVESDERLTILADSKEAGLFLCMAQEGRQIL